MTEPPTPPPAAVGDDATTLGRAGFASNADVYERARPGYPDETVTELLDRTGPRPGGVVLDLAAGTGKLTRQLAARGLRCIAAEPSAVMRATFASVLPGVPVVGSTAERLPFATGALDVVVVAQAFHWFDPPAALAEMHRVLRPGGGLAMVWNERDEEDPVVAELVRISKWDTMAPYPVGKDFAPVIGTGGWFGPVVRSRRPFVQHLTRAALVEQVASRSYVNVLPDAERRSLLDEVAAFAATLPEPIPVPYVTDLFCARSLPR